jgi:hypothetical protein
MRRETRLFALRAAAKVALVLPLSACSERANAPANVADGGSIDVAQLDAELACGRSGSGFDLRDAAPEAAVADALGDGAADSTEAADAVDADADTADTDLVADASDAATSTEDTGEAGAPRVVSEATFECCATVLEAALPPNVSFATFFDPSHDHDPSLDACCRAVLAQMDAEEYPDPDRYHDDYVRAGTHGGVWSCCGRLLLASSPTCNAGSGGPLAPPPIPPAVARLAPVAPLDLRVDGRRAMRSLSLLSEHGARGLEAWHRRMVDEHTSARVFDALAAELVEAGFAAEDAESCLRFAAEERRHGVLCAAVVEALGGDARAAPAPMPEVPRHEGLGAHEAALRNVLSICCVSETLAVALIAAERHELPAGVLREIVTSIWSDEIGHARFGWRLLVRELPRLDDKARARLAAYARIAVEHSAEHFEVRRRGVAPGDRAGTRSALEARTLVRDVIDQVLSPAFEALGLRDGRARE